MAKPINDANNLPKLPKIEGDKNMGKVSDNFASGLAKGLGIEKSVEPKRSKVTENEVNPLLEKGIDSVIKNENIWYNRLGGSPFEYSKRKNELLNRANYALKRMGIDFYKAMNSSPKDWHIMPIGEDVSDSEYDFLDGLNVLDNLRNDYKDAQEGTFNHHLRSHKSFDPLNREESIKKFLNSSADDDAWWDKLFYSTFTKDDKGANEWYDALTQFYNNNVFRNLFK